MNGKDREIQSWIANTPEASFISMAVHGQSLYRLNYPFRYGRWHFQCTSWNGKTGEWQLWIRGERIGRGFHNRVSLYEWPEISECVLHNDRVSEMSVINNNNCHFYSPSDANHLFFWYDHSTALTNHRFCVTSAGRPCH